jgi:putative nucleotidyltransferase with HDIG domain
MGADGAGRMRQGESATDEWSRPGTSGAEPRPPEWGPSSTEEGEHVVIGRLIRRLKISDPPARFQALATNVLRASFGAEAVAWVPAEDHEDVTVSGEVIGMTPRCHRLLAASLGRDGVSVADGPEAARAALAPPAVRRFAAVAAGSTGVLIVVNPADGRPLGPLEVERGQYVASLIAAQSNNARIYAELKDLLFGIIRALTAAIDAKDPYTSGHSERVARIAVRIAEEMGMPPHKRSDLYLTGLLHDIGKIGIDDEVLKKVGALTPEEYRRIQEHVEIGVTILQDLKKLRHILPGVRHHHESLDGTGYPDQLAGEEIPVEARILAVADSFDAMSSNRPYRRRLSPMQIDDILAKGRGTQWDPDVIDALQACRMDVEAIRQKGLGDSLIGAVDVTLGRR